MVLNESEYHDVVSSHIFIQTGLECQNSTLATPACASVEVALSIMVQLNKLSLRGAVIDEIGATVSGV